MLTIYTIKNENVCIIFLIFLCRGQYIPCSQLGRYVYLIFLANITHSHERTIKNTQIYKYTNILYVYSFELCI